MAMADLALWTGIRSVLRTQESRSPDGIRDLFFPIQATKQLLLANMFCQTHGEIES